MRIAEKGFCFFFDIFQNCGLKKATSCGPSLTTRHWLALIWHECYSTFTHGGRCSRLHVCVRLWGRSCGGVRATSWNLLHSCIMEADANSSQPEKSEQNYWETVSTMLADGCCLAPPPLFTFVGVLLFLLFVLGVGDWQAIGRWLSIELNLRAILMPLLLASLQVQASPLSATWCHRDTQKGIHLKRQLTGEEGGN